MNDEYVFFFVEVVYWINFDVIYEFVVDVGIGDEIGYVFFGFKIFS